MVFKKQRKEDKKHGAEIDKNIIEAESMGPGAEPAIQSVTEVDPENEKEQEQENE